MLNSLNIAITGAGGFLGTSLVEKLSLSGQASAIHALYSKEVATKYPLAKKVVGNLEDRSVVADLLDGVDIVIHLASRGYPLDTTKNYQSINETNLEATKAIIEVMQKRKIKKILFASSGGAIYSKSDSNVPYNELSTIELRSAYAENKKAIENLLLNGTGIEPFILRISNPFGVHQLTHQGQGFIAAAFRKLLEKRALPIWGSLDTCKDFLYIDDMLVAFLMLLEKNIEPGIYNVGSGVGHTLKSVIETIEKVTGQKLNLLYESGKKEDSSWTVLDCSKFRRASGWACTYSLEDGIGQMWQKILQQSYLK
ncbi:MAG: NAD-dependent epimerase/dehydratase family protein [Deltaproteobacteria bacterium]|nr:NAD-dependent epimerase/dehydratase family protein [Deltaproteobacteria bacterium]